MDERMVEKVLTVVESIPPGSVAAYGEIARIVGTGPRHVGTIMRVHGAFVPWWRVVNASGDLPAHVRARAWRHWDDEGIVRKPNARGCRIDDHRTDLDALAATTRARLRQLDRA